MRPAWLQTIAFVAIVVAGGTPYFFIFWTWFDFWRKRRALWYVMVGTVLGGVAVAVWLGRHWALGPHWHFPTWVQAIGWVYVTASTVLGFVADRQIGIRVRSFRPFFDAQGHIELKTNGAYAVVRHPIYVAVRWLQIGVFLITGYPLVLIALVVFGLGSIWFTRQEEERLMSLLEDPQAYVRYRARVPALLPWPRPRTYARSSGRREER